jgi:hypothetical protein
MRLRVLAALPLLAAALFLLCMLATGAASSAPAYRWEELAVKLLAAAGCFVGARPFAPGDRLRRAWTFQGLGYLLLATRALPLLARLPAATATTALFVANLLAVLSSALMVRAWYGAGLGSAIPPGRRRVTVLAALTVALGLAGPAVAAATSRLAEDPVQLVKLIGGLGDIVGLTLLAPLLLIAVAMRGGRLAWPWGLFAAAILSWLLYDGLDLASGHLAPALFRAASESLRVAACLFHACAGLAQREVARTERARS